MTEGEIKMIARMSKVDPMWGEMRQRLPEDANIVSESSDDSLSDVFTTPSSPSKGTIVETEQNLVPLKSKTSKMAK
jgi:hypothetical protein